MIVEFLDAEKVCFKIFDGTHESPKARNRGRLMITSKNLQSNSIDFSGASLISEDDFQKIQKRSRVKQWDILFSMIGSVGRVYLEESSNPDYAIKNIGVFSCGSEELARKLYYYFQTPFASNYIKSSCAGAIQKFLSLKELKKFPIPTYLNESLVKVLTLIDQKISINLEINRNLEAMAHQIYEYWFTQFNFPDENGRPYKFSGGKMLWNERLKRYVPEGWRICKIKDFLKNDYTGDWGFDTPNDDRIQVSCIRGADIAKLNNLPVRYIKVANKHKLLRPFDLVVEVSGGSPTQATGRAAYITPGIIKRNGGKVTCSNFCHSFSMEKIEFSAFFFFLWTQLYENGIMFNFEGKTSGIKNFMTESFLSNEWYFPSTNIMALFFEKISRIYGQIDSNIAEINQLIKMKDLLLPMLMNGQISLNQQEKNCDLSSG